MRKEIFAFLIFSSCTNQNQKVNNLFDIYTESEATIYIENNLWENIWFRTPTRILGEVRAKENGCFLIKEKGRVTISFDYLGRTYTTPPFNPKYYKAGWKLSLERNPYEDVMKLEPYEKCYTEKF
jgi:hypothetical protein